MIEPGGRLQHPDAALERLDEVGAITGQLRRRHIMAGSKGVLPGEQEIGEKFTTPRVHRSVPRAAGAWRHSSGDGSS